MNFIPLLQAQTGAAQPQGGGFMTIIMFVLIFVIFYFFIIRPQNKKQKETERMINALRKGDRVITIGGIHGEVAAVREKTFVLKVEDGSRIEFSRSAISSVINDEEPAKPAKKSAKAEAAAKTEPAKAGEDGTGAEEAAAPADGNPENASGPGTK